jgi:hypothetical protein
VGPVRSRNIILVITIECKRTIKPSLKVNSDRKILMANCLFIDEPRKLLRQEVIEDKEILIFLNVTMSPKRRFK